MAKILAYNFLAQYLEGVCGKPVDGINTKNVTQSTGKVGDMYTYLCEEGYRIINNGTLNSVCLGEEWTLDHEPPTCEGK